MREFSVLVFEVLDQMVQMVEMVSIHRKILLQMVYYKKGSTVIFSLVVSHPRWIERRGKELEVLQTFFLQLTFEIISQFI